MNEVELEKSKWLNALLRMWYQRFRQSLADIRWSRLRYMLIFAHAPFFANVQERLFDPDPLLGGINAITLMRLTYCLGAGLLFAFASLKNMQVYSKSLASAAALFFSLWFIVGQGSAAVLFGCAFTFCYGGCAAMAAFHFAYALNDSERFLGAALTTLYYALFQIVIAAAPPLLLFTRLYMGGLVLVSVTCIFYYRAQDYWESAARKHSGGQAPVALMLYFFFAYHIVEMFYTYIQGKSSSRILFLNGLVGVLIVILALYLYFRVKFNLWHMCNIFFIAFLITYILRLLTDQASGCLAASVFRSFEQVGFIVAYSLLGSVMQKYVAFRTFKWVLLGTLNSFTLTYALLGIVLPKFSSTLPLLASLVTFAFFIVFLLLAPAYAKNIFDWKNLSVLPKEGERRETFGTVQELIVQEAEAKEKQAGESQTVSTGYEDHHKFSALVLDKKLTSRESEIVWLLLRGYLYKQCASELSISIETVKFHTRNAYRKLDISSRSELFSLLVAEGKPLQS